MKKTIIIAEAGVNHNGDLDTAIRMIDAAAVAGVDYIKFQTFNTKNLVSKEAPKADYQINNGVSESQFDMLKKLELSKEDHYKLIEHSNKSGIRFLSTAFDLESLSFLKDLGLTLFKIPSGEITNLPYLWRVAELADHIILSTGMCTMEEVTDAVNELRNKGNKNITILHCNTEYPTPYTDVNLLAMNTIARQFGCPVGYSDHTLGIEVPIAAVALGATVIEKHFTLDKKMIGPDHAASLEPHELIGMVRAIRNTENALGTTIKEPSASESKNIAVARKSIHLSRSKQIGDIFSAEDFEMLRPGDGISPMRLYEVVGKTVTRDLSAGSKLQFTDFI
jgi:N-acetylneuraminate synthase